MCVLLAVEDGQGPCIALVPHVGICWIDGDSSQVHHEMASEDGAHALAQQVKDSLHTLPAETPPLLPVARELVSTSIQLPPRDSACAMPYLQVPELPCHPFLPPSVPRPGWKREAVLWEHKSALSAAAQGLEHKAMHLQGFGLPVPSLVQALAGLTSNSDLVSDSKW